MVPSALGGEILWNGYLLFLGIGGRALSPVAARRSKAKGANEVYSKFKNWLRSPTPLLPTDIQKTVC